MKKIEFKNLPDKTTPINSTNLNKIQDNVEALFEGNESMGEIAVEDVVCKNLFDKNNYNLVNLYPSMNGTFAKYTGTGWSIYIEIKPSTTYTITKNVYDNDDLIVATCENIPADGGLCPNVKKQMLTESVKYTTITSGATDKYLVVYMAWVNTMLQEIIDNLQIEKGSVSTKYTPFKQFGYNSQESMGEIVVDDIKNKNILISTATNQTKNGLTVTVNEEKIVHITGTTTSATTIALGGGFSSLTLDAGQYVLSVGNNTPSGVYINAYYSSATLLTQLAPTTNQRVLDVATKTTYNNFRVECYINNNTTVDMTLKPMLEKGSVATNYVEHKEYDNSKLITNEKTTSKTNTYSCNYINNLIFKPMRSTTNMNDLTESGIFTLNASTNVPAGTAYYNVAVFYYDTNSNYAYMIATKLDDPNIYVRYKFETWTEWKKIVPTAI